MEIEKRQNIQPRKFGGWLLLLGGMLIFGFLLSVASLKNDVSEYLQVYSENIGILSSPNSEYYSPLWGPSYIFRGFLYIFIFIAGNFSLILFFKKKKMFPIYYITFLCFSFLSSLFMIFNDQMISGDPVTIESFTQKPVIGLMINMITLIPYLVFSKRVKETFTLPLVYRLSKQNTSKSKKISWHDEETFFKNIKVNENEDLSKPETWARSTSYYMRAFKDNPDREIVFKWNTFSFFFPVIWFINRKMYLYTFFAIIIYIFNIYITANIVYILPALSTLTFYEIVVIFIISLFISPMSFVLGSIGTSIYIRWAYKKLGKPKKQNVISKGLLYAIILASLLFNSNLALDCDVLLAETLYERCSYKDGKTPEDYCVTLSETRIQYYSKRALYLLFTYCRDPLRACYNLDHAVFYLEEAVKQNYYMALLTYGKMLSNSDNPQDMKEGTEYIERGLDELPSSVDKEDAMQEATDEAAELVLRRVEL